MKSIEKKWGPPEIQKVLGSILSWIPDFVFANFIPSPNLTSRRRNAGVQIATNDLELLTVQAHSQTFSNSGMRLCIHSIL